MTFTNTELLFFDSLFKVFYSFWGKENGVNRMKQVKTNGVHL